MLAKREDIDLERELHKVYKMFCNNQIKLIEMKGTVGTVDLLARLVTVILCCC